MALALLATSTSPAQEANPDSSGQPERGLKNSQWSLQGTWVINVASHDEMLATGETRPAGPMGHLQARVAWRVIPKSLPTIPIVSRLKLQTTRSQSGEWGIAPTELFTLALPGSWNISGEYKTSGQYKNWAGPAVKHAFRFNVGYSFKDSPDLLAVFD